MPRPLIHLQTVSRNCDICGQAPGAPLFEFQRVARCSQADFAWHVQVRVCGKCGFGYVSPAPTHEALEQYYGQSFARYDGAKPDYSIRKRINLISRHSGGLAKLPFVEIGSNNSPEFHESLSAICPIIRTVELNEHCDAGSRNTRSMEDGAAGMVAAYFVLEHVPDPVSFLRDCRRLVRSDGIIIIEVPDRSFYPADVSSLGNYEHTNHFSALSLSNAGAQAGLRLREITHLDCSRPFGIAAVFTPAEGISPACLVAAEILDTVSTITAGAEKLREFHRTVNTCREAIRAARSLQKTVIVWAANETSLQLLDDDNLLRNVLIVDSDPAKAGYFSPHPVCLPSDCVEQLRTCSLLVICAHLHINSILAWIASHVSRTFDVGQLVCLEPPVLPTS